MLASLPVTTKPKVMRKALPSNPPSLEAIFMPRSIAVIGASSKEATVGYTVLRGVTIEPMIKRDGYELILGSSFDAQFGPVILFGMGGQLVEVFKDHVLGMPPLTATIARSMIEQTMIVKALQGVCVEENPLTLLHWESS